MLNTITATEILTDHVITEPTPTERVRWTVTANEVEFARYELRDALDRWDDTRIISAAQGIAWVIGSARCDGATAIALERMSVADRISMIVDIASTTDCAYDDAKAYVSRWSTNLSVLMS